jgi:hypothetical protein
MSPSLGDGAIERVAAAIAAFASSPQAGATA